MTIGEFFTLLGYGVGALVFFVAARGRKLATEGMAYVALAGLCGGVLGARIGSWLSAPQAALLALNGKALMGGLIGGWLAVELAKKHLGIRRSTGDLWALALPAGEAVGRLGCYFNGCCFGAPCQLPWAVYQHEAWRHPAPLYAAGIAAMIFVILLIARARLTSEGALFRWWILLFAAGRFVLEFFRDSPAQWLNLSLAQWLCAEVFISAALWHFFKKRAALRLQNNVSPEGSS